MDDFLDHDDQDIETDKLYEIARLIDNDFFLESIKEQIFDGLDCTTTDYLSTFNIKVDQVIERCMNDDATQLLNFKSELCFNIIQWVEEKYGIDIVYEDENLEKAAKQVYQLFVTELKDIIIAGVVAYIVENYTTLIDSIGKDNLKTSFVTTEMSQDDEYHLIAAGNIGTLVDVIADNCISFDEFITYAGRAGDNEILADIANDNYAITLSDADTVFSTLMQNIRDSEYDHTIIIDIYEKVLSQFNISSKQVSVHGENFDITYPDMDSEE